MPDYTAARERMVAQIRARQIDDPVLLGAMLAVPRHQFVRPEDRGAAYDDTPLPIAAGQTISQPFMVATMISLAQLRRSHRVIEIGAGSGYAAAILSRLVDRVVAIERHKLLAVEARERLGRLGYDNVRLMHGDGLAGCPDEAPFDVIIVSAAAQAAPRALCDQLAVGGRLIVPIGPRGGVQELVKIIRREDGFERLRLGAVRFVPLVGGLES